MLTKMKQRKNENYLRWTTTWTTWTTVKKEKVHCWRLSLEVDTSRRRRRVASKCFLRYRGGIIFLMPCNFRPQQEFKNILAMPGIQYIFPLHHVNKPGKFERGIINPHLFTSIDLFSVLSNTAAKSLALIRP